MLSVQSFARLPPEPGSVRDARRQVGQTLSRAGHEEWADDAVLAVSEVVTNVVLHARTDCEVAVCVTADDARVSVRDFSPLPPVHRQHSQYATTGRGIPLVTALSTDFGITPLGSHGKVVWFTLTGLHPSDDAVADALRSRPQSPHG